MTTETAPTPSWLDGFVDILRARRGTWIAAAVAVVLVAALLALLAPSLLPPTPLVGAAVGIAAALLATALVVALDSADLVVRGPRHVVAAGGVVAGTISRAPGDIDALLVLIDQHAGDHGVRVALTPASRAAGVPGARANMVAEELARRDLKVLCTDLTRGRTPAIGLSDVLSGQRKLADAVRFDEELFLAHLAVGSEPEAALAGFAGWAAALPDDLDVLVAALPPLAEPGVLPAVQGVELVLVLVEVDRTERVDLIACLDAIDAAGVPAALVLVDPDLDTIPELSTTVAVLDHAPDEDFHPEDPESRLHTVDLVDAPDAPPGGADETGGSPDLPPGGLDDEQDGLDDGDGDHEADADVGPESAADATPAPEQAPESAEPSEPEAPSQPVEEPTTGQTAEMSQDDGEVREGVRVLPGRPVSTQEAESAPAASTEGDPTGAASAAATGPVTGPVTGSDGDERRVPPQRPQREPLDYEDDDDDAQPPVVGGGHVRTLRARRAATPVVDPTGEGGPATDVGHGETPAPLAAQPSDEESPPDQPAPDQPVPAPQAQHDEIDTTAREAARLTASLHALANEVWQRGDE